MRHDEAALAGGGPAEPAGGPAILIIEDNETNALILRSMLRKQGYDAAVATDGVAGVEAAALMRPRLILMDLHMPRLDGFAAAARIRGMGNPARTAIVAVTASASPEVQAACLTSGFAAVLPKPVMLGELGAIVQKFFPGP